MDKLIIPKYRPKRTACQSRIRPEHYQQIAELSAESGQSVQFVIDNLLEFALNRAGVAEVSEI